MGVSDVGRRKRFRVIFNVLARKKFDSSFICLSPKVGYLVPLNRHFKEQALVSNFAVSDVINVTRCNNIISLGYLLRLTLFLVVSSFPLDSF